MDYMDFWVSKVHFVHYTRLKIFYKLFLFLKGGQNEGKNK